MQNYSTKELSNIIYYKLNESKTYLQNYWNNKNSFHADFFYIDDLLPKNITEEIYNILLKMNKTLWNKNTSFREKKKGFFELDKVNVLISNVTEAFHQPNVINIIESITKIKNLEADPSLYAGGISMMNKDDFLNPHIDNSHDRKKKKYRRLNLLFYVSPKWEEKMGGNLELWSKNVKERKTIESKFNRLVVMNANKYSWHSVSKVKVEQARCCISNYYFTKNSPENKEYYHVTSFNGRPDENVKRIYCLFDNFFRQQISNLFKISRGKNLIRK